MWFRASRRIGLKCLYCMRARKESDDDDRVKMDRMEKRRSLHSCERTRERKEKVALTISSFLNYKLRVCARKFCASEHVFMIRLYDVRNVPSSYRQPGGRGQLLSRRYRTHSGWSFS